MTINLHKFMHAQPGGPEAQLDSQNEHKNESQRGLFGSDPIDELISPE
jgi:hypothetical protein